MSTIHTIPFPSSPSGEPFLVITTSDPEFLRRAVHAHQFSPFIILRRPARPTDGGYAPERIHMHRVILQTEQKFIGKTYTDEQYRTFEGECWPDDLSQVTGLWTQPLNCSLSNLVIVDLTIHDALFWVIPILDALGNSPALRRLILRFRDDWDLLPFPFPFLSLDQRVSAIPSASVLIAWAEDKTPFVDVFRRNLPRLHEAGKLRPLYLCQYYFISL